MDQSNRLDRFTFVERCGESIVRSAEEHGTPQYLYSNSILSNNCCRILRDFPHAYGLTVRYAMKANSSGTLLKIIAKHGIHIDASSFNEAKRALKVGIPHDRILLTSQQILFGNERNELEECLLKGLKITVCSMQQYDVLSAFLRENVDRLEGIYVRVHPGVGSGGDASRNTGDEYSCFGVHLGNDLKTLIRRSRQDKIKIIGVHVHIGSGGDPETWESNVDRELEFLKEYDLNDVENINFGGGFRIARMEDEVQHEADIKKLGDYTKSKIEEFYKSTGRELKVEIEPGTFLVANCGFIVTTVLDWKETMMYKFIILDGGMELNTRPSLYGAKHPFYVIQQRKEIKDSQEEEGEEGVDLVVVGKCCESGDCQTMSEGKKIEKRRFRVKPRIGDYVVIGGSGAYTSTMSPFNYNSHLQVPEILLFDGDQDGRNVVIRKRQTFEQLLQNEIILDEI